jgi:oxygen-dependent protoporphyrinogen oxidase
MANIVIVGAGISGLSLAFRLEQLLPDANVRVLEQLARPGGTIWTESRDGFRVEIGPNGFLDTKPTTLQLCRELGLERRLVAASEVAGRNRFLYLNNRLHLLPNSLASLLRTDLLSWRGKLNLLIEPLRKPRSDGHDESIDTFARRRAGREVAAVFADAMVTGIYAGDPSLLSLRASFPRIAQLEEHFGSVLRGMNRSARERRAEAAARGEPYQRPGKMWSFADGLRLLVETLSARLRHPPVLGAGIRRVSWSPDPLGNWLVEAHGQDRWRADAMILTCPAYQQAALLADLDPVLADEVNQIPYNRVAVIALGYRQADLRQKLDGFGYIAPQRLRRDVLGVQWCSSIFPERALPGMVLLRALCGGWQRPEIPGWNDARLLEAVQAELALTMGIRVPPVFHHIVRWDRAIPQYQLGHLQRVAGIDRRLCSHPGLFLGGNAYRGVAMNDCTEQAIVLAEAVKRFLSSSPVSP